MSGGLVLRFRCDGHHLHTVPPWPLSGSTGPVLVHALQPRLVPKRIRAAFLSLLLSRNVLRNVGSDRSHWIVSSGLVLCCRSNCRYLHRMCPRFLSTGSGAASVHVLQSRAVLLRLWAHCCDGQLPSRIVLSCRCNCCCLHALSRRHDESKHWASGLQSMQPGRLLLINRSCCCKRLVPNGHVLPRRSIVCNVHPVRPWQVLRIFRAWICVWHLPNWFIFYRRRCVRCLRRLPRGHAAECHRTVVVRAMLSRHVLRVCGAQQSNRPLQSRIVLFWRRHSTLLHQLQRRYISAPHRTRRVLALQSRHVLRDDRPHRRNWKVCGRVSIRRVRVVPVMHSVCFWIFSEPNGPKILLALRCGSILQRYRAYGGQRAVLPWILLIWRRQLVCLQPLSRRQALCRLGFRVCQR